MRPNQLPAIGQMRPRTDEACRAVIKYQSVRKSVSGLGVDKGRCAYALGISRADMDRKLLRIA